MVPLVMLRMALVTPLLAAAFGTFPHRDGQVLTCNGLISTLMRKLSDEEARWRPEKRTRSRRKRGTGRRERKTRRGRMMRMRSKVGEEL